METTRLYRTVLTAAGILVALGTILQNVVHKSTYSETVQQAPFQVGSWVLVVGYLALILAVWQLHTRLDEGLPWGRLSAAAAAIGSGLALPGQVLLGAALVRVALRGQPRLVAEPAAMAA